MCIIRLMKKGKWEENGKMFENRVGSEADLQNPFDHIFLSIKRRDELHLGQ